MHFDCPRCGSAVELADDAGTAVVTGAIARTNSGYSTPHANAWNPPDDGPGGGAVT